MSQKGIWQNPEYPLTNSTKCAKIGRVSTTRPIFMATRLFILTTGEYVISNITDEDLSSFQKYELDLNLINPKLVITTNTQKNSDDQNQLQTNVVLLTWPQFTLDTKIIVNPETIVSEVTPIKELENLYLESLQ